MAFPNDIDLHTTYDADAPAATDKISAATLDADHLELERWINEELLPALAQILRDDGTLPDYLVRYRNLHPEVFSYLSEAAGSVELAVPADGSVSTLKMALLAVTTAILADGAVTTAKLADDAVTADKIAAGGVDTTAIANVAVTAAKIALGVITDAHIASGAAIAWSKISTSGAAASDVGAAAASHGHSAADVTSGTMAQDRLGSGSGGAGAKFLADDQTWKTPSAGSSYATGDPRMYFGLDTPAGFLECDGTAVSRSTYAELFAFLCPSETLDQSTNVDIGTDTISTAAATMARTGLPLRLSSSGVMPTGLATATTYYAIKTGTNSMKLATSLANALAGTAINITATGSGTLTVQYFPFGGGDWSTTFNVPDMRRRAGVGEGGTGTSTLAACLGASGGAETHTLTTSQIPSHAHREYAVNASNGAQAAMSRPQNTGGSSGYTSISYDTTVNGDSSADVVDLNTGSAGSGGSHNNMQPSLVVRYLIKT